MADCQWADISEFQPLVNNEYTLPILTIRSNDGTYRDQHFDANYAWCKSAVSSGKLSMFIVYYFYRPNGQGFNVLQSRCGTPPAKMAVMIDVEAAGGQVSGNQSAEINREFDAAAAWLGDKRRVIGYGNVGDLNSLWPQKPAGIRIIVAAYGSNRPTYPGMYGWQFTENAHNTAPFPTCDMNVSPGMDLQANLAMFGFTGTTPTPPPKEKDVIAAPCTFMQGTAQQCFWVASNGHLMHSYEISNKWTTEDLAGSWNPDTELTYFLGENNVAQVWGMNASAKPQQCYWSGSKWTTQPVP